MKRKEQSGCWGWDRGWLLLGTVIFALALTACGGGGGGGGGPTSAEVPVVLGQPGPGDAGNRFPFTVGNVWRFQGTSVETGLPQETFVNTVTVTGPRQVGEVSATGFQESNPGNLGVPVESFMVKDANGIANFGNSDLTDTVSPQLVPFWELRFPLEPGASFVSLDRQGIDFGEDLDGDGVNERGDLRSVVTVAGFETVTVPVGIFENSARLERTLTLTATLSGDGSRVTLTDTATAWFASNVGWVKRTEDISFPAGDFFETETEELVGFSVDGITQGL